MIHAFSYMRGRTFENAWIIADESQNMTPNQMLMLLTRIGEGSKMIVTGDIRQHDRGYERNGLSDLLQRIAPRTPPPPAAVGAPVIVDVEASETQPCTASAASAQHNHHGDIGIVEFTHKDVERHPVIKTILKLYSDLSSGY